jgi:hypothetical protein
METGLDESARPTRPQEPGPDECCGQGCRMCVWDMYQEKLDRYEDDIRAWELGRSPMSAAPAIRLPQSFLSISWGFTGVYRVVMRHLK